VIKESVKLQRVNNLVNNLVNLGLWFTRVAGTVSCEERQKNLSPTRLVSLISISRLASRMAMAVTDKYTELELYDLELNEQLQYLDRKIQQLEQDLQDPSDDSIPEGIDRDQLPETIHNLEVDCDRLKGQLSEAFHRTVIKTTAERSLDVSHMVIKSLYPE
jgi:hypothetical protein